MEGELFINLLFSQEGARIIHVVVVRPRTLTHTRSHEAFMHLVAVTALIRWFMLSNGELDDLTRPDMSLKFFYHLYPATFLLNSLPRHRKTNTGITLFQGM